MFIYEDTNNLVSGVFLKCFSIFNGNRNIKNKESTSNGD